MTLWRLSIDLNSTTTLETANSLKFGWSWIARSSSSISKESPLQAPQETHYPRVSSLFLTRGGHTLRQRVTLILRLPRNTEIAEGSRIILSLFSMEPMRGKPNKHSLG